MSSNPSPEALSAAERIKLHFWEHGRNTTVAEVAALIDAAYAERLERLERENERLREAGAALQSAYTRYTIAGTTSAKERARVECEEKLESLFAALEAPSEGGAK